MLELDHLYFARRAREERTAADRAVTEEARATHLRMADLFDQLRQACLRRHSRDQG